MPQRRAVPVNWETLASTSIAPDQVRRSIAILRERNSAWFESAETASALGLVAVLAASPALARRLEATPDWLRTVFDPESLEHGRRSEGLRRDAQALLDAAMAQADHARALEELRHFRHRELIRIVARDLTGQADLATITRELSDLADVSLGGVLRVVRARVASQLGEPWELEPDGTWRPTEFCIVGLGKLGGQELNYSSDVDVIFVYGAEGHVFRDPPAPRARPSNGGLTSHEFFRQLAEEVIAEVEAATAAGQLYRIDVRLRPEGAGGPLARSVESYENYYAQWGQTWERLTLMKARPVAGDRGLGSEFIESIQQFRYPRAATPHLIAEVAATKQRMESDAIAGDVEHDVKRGRGGIREIEFITQALQLLHGGRQPFLQGAGTLPTIDRLASYQLITPAEAVGLAKSYTFWRNVEHRLQLEALEQTHTLPSDDTGRLRISRLMGHGRLADFERTRLRHASLVRAAYDKYVLSTCPPDANSRAHVLPDSFDSANDATWRTLLGRHGFRDPDSALNLLREFVEGSGRTHVSQRTGELGMRLIPRLLSRCDGAPASGRLSDPDRVLARLGSFIGAYRARAPLYELWDSRPALFDLLLALFDRSEHLAEMAIRAPDLMEELLAAGRLRRAKTATETLKELRFGSADANQHAWIRRYHQAEQLRIGLRSIVGITDFEQAGAELTALAGACLHYAGETAARLSRQRRLGFAIIGLGRLGGSELDFGSDLDLIFVAPENTRHLAAHQRTAEALLDLVASRRESGVVFACNTRLRPGGDDGPLVTTLGASEDYFRHRAPVWELLALSRARLVGGDEETGRRFLELTRRLTDFSRGNPGLQSWTDSWRAEIAQRRARIEREAGAGELDSLAFKTGTGGIIEAEFIAQIVSLGQGWQEPNTAGALERAGAAGILDATHAAALLGAYRELRRIECILRRWSFQGECVLPRDNAALQRVAVRCGFATADQLLASTDAARRTVRDTWNAFTRPPNTLNGTRGAPDRRGKSDRQRGPGSRPPSAN